MDVPDPSTVSSSTEYAEADRRDPSITAGFLP
jgi:hypothetical protein